MADPSVVNSTEKQTPASASAFGPVQDTTDRFISAVDMLLDGNAVAHETKRLCWSPILNQRTCDDLGSVPWLSNNTSPH